MQYIVNLSNETFLPPKVNNPFFYLFICLMGYIITSRTIIVRKLQEEIYSVF